MENSNILPVITLYQPWATWIMRGWKTIETRTHAKFASINHKDILIHAGQTTDKSDITVNNPYLSKEQLLENPDEMINGFILGSVHVYDFMKLTKHDSRASLIDCESIERFGLFLENINRWEIPIPEKGEMGIWYYDLDNMMKVKKPKLQTELFSYPQATLNKLI